MFGRLFVIVGVLLLCLSCQEEEPGLVDGRPLTEDQKVDVILQLCVEMIKARYMNPEAELTIDWGLEPPSEAIAENLDRYSRWSVVTEEDFRRLKRGIRATSSWIPEGGVVRLEVEGLNVNFAPDLYEFLMHDGRWYHRTDTLLRGFDCSDLD